MVPEDLRKPAAIPFAPALLPSCAGVDMLTRILFLLLKEVAVLLNDMHEVPNVVTEELTAAR